MKRFFKIKVVRTPEVLPEVDFGTPRDARQYAAEESNKLYFFKPDCRLILGPNRKIGIRGPTQTIPTIPRNI